MISFTRFLSIVDIFVFICFIERYALRILDSSYKVYLSSVEIPAGPVHLYSLQLGLDVRSSLDYVFADECSSAAASLGLQSHCSLFRTRQRSANLLRWTLGGAALIEQIFLLRSDEWWRLNPLVVFFIFLHLGRSFIEGLFTPETLI